MLLILKKRNVWVNATCTWTENFLTFFYSGRGWIDEKQAPLYCLCTAWLMMRTKAYIPSALRNNFLWKKLGWSHRSIPFCCLSSQDESYRSFLSGREQVVRETRADLKTCTGFLFKGSAAACMLGASLCPVPWWLLQWSEMP